MDIDSIWTETLLILRRQTTQATYDAILANTRLVSLADDSATISTETEQAMEWLENRLRANIARALGNVLDREIAPDQVAFVVGELPEGDDERPFYVRNRRKARRFYIDNEFFDWGHAAHVGPISIAVYNVLCFRADANSQQCYPGKGYIAKMIGVSQVSTVREAIERLEAVNIIHRTQRYDETSKTYSSDLYDLLDISEWKTLPDIKEV